MLVAEGTYTEAVELRDGVGVHGGYAADWTRALDRITRIAAPSRVGARATGVVTPTALQLLTITAAAGKFPGFGN